MSKLDSLNHAVEEVTGGEVTGNDVQQNVIQEPTHPNLQQPVQQIQEPQHPNSQQVNPQQIINGQDNDSLEQQQQSDPYEDISSMLDDLQKDLSGNVNIEQQQIENQVENEKTLDNENEKNITSSEEDSLVNDLKTKLEEERYKRLQVEVERDRYKELFNSEKSKVDEFLTKTKDLERDLKKMKTQVVPEDIQDLVEYYRLAKEANNIYNVRNLVARSLQIVEQFTNTPTEGYILEWLRKGDLLQSEGQQVADKSELKQGPDKVNSSSVISNIMT